MASRVAELVIKGQEKLIANLEKLVASRVQEAGAALRAEGELIMTEAKRRTPVLTGVLRGSGHVTGPEPGATIEVRLAFGGPAADYAVYVHENMQSFHHVGQAKFLESAVLEAAPRLAGNIAVRIKLK